LISRLSSDLLETRARALEEIKGRWESWSDADLGKLRALVDSKNADLASNARAAVAHIELRRKYSEIPPEVWTAFPELAALLDKGDPEAVGRMLQSMAEKVTRKALSLRAVLPAALEFMEDDRDTKIGSGFFSGGREHTYEVNDLARDLLWDGAPGLARQKSVADARAWWRKHKGKTDREWHLDGLSQEDEILRAASLVRLAALKDATLHPKLIEALKGIASQDGLRLVKGSFNDLPAGQLLPELRGRLKVSNLDMRLDLISAISDIKDPGAEELLIEAFDDGEQRFKAWYGRIAEPRVCDFAGLLLESRLHPDEELPDWPDSVRARDQKLEELRNLWRKKRGLPPIPFPGPGIVPVAPGRVAELIPDLTHESAERRLDSLKRLSQLGPGAWGPFQDLVAAASPPAKDRLVKAATDWSNALRSVKAENDEAREYVKLLEAGLHQPFDFPAFHQKVLGAWYDDGALIGLEVDIKRGADGRGVTISLKVVKAKKPGVEPKTIRIYAGGSGCVLNCKRKWFDEQMQKDFDEDLLSAMRSGPEKQAGFRLYLRKAGPDGKPLPDFDPDE
jgi:hypothetical protein